MYADHTSGSAVMVHCTGSHPKPERPHSSLTVSYSCFSCARYQYSSAQYEKIRNTFCHLLLMASARFVIPPDRFSLPVSARVHSAQTGGLGLLSPQCPLLFSAVSVCSSIASSAWDHLTLSFFPSIVPSEKMSKQTSRMGKESGPDRGGTWCGFPYAQDRFMGKTSE